MRNTNKKGFTIVQLVIVVAVIAILAAVLIPTFSGIIAKANLSADQQAVRQMNTVLSSYVGDEIENIADAKINLTENGIDANNYKPLTVDHDFYYLADENRVVLFNTKEKKVVYPVEYQDAKYDAANWMSLGGIGDQAAEEKLVTGGILSGTIDLKGASVNLKPTSDFTIGGASAADADMVTIKNLVCDESTNRKALELDAPNNAVTYVGMIATVPSGVTVTVKNLIIDGAVIGDCTNPYTGKVGIIAGAVEGTLKIENVIIRNATVFGFYDVGSLVGAVHTNGKVEITNVTIEDTVVKGAEGAASVIGTLRCDLSNVTVSGLTMNRVTVEVSEFNNSYTNTDGTIYTLDFSKTYTRSNGDVFIYDDGDIVPLTTDNHYWIRHSGGYVEENGVKYWDRSSGNFN